MDGCIDPRLPIHITAARILLACSARRYRRPHPGAAGPRLCKVELVLGRGDDREARVGREEASAREVGIPMKDI